MGENGRETFVPESNGTILPNGAGMGGQTVINFNITANDTRGFDQLLTQRRGLIVGMINSALNERGKGALV